MSLPGHRRTSSHKRRRASHFALVAPALTVSASGTHLMHHAAPGATEYNGKAIHVKGHDKKVSKLLAKSRAKTTKAHADHGQTGPAHDHAGHNHA